MRIVAYGKPITQGSKVRNRYSGMRDDNAKTLKPWRERVHHAALEALDGKARIEGPVVIDVTFWFDRPAGHYRTGRNAHMLRDAAPAFPDNKGSGDIDKLQRACFDALTSAGVWRDDSQVVKVSASKRFCENCPGHQMPKPGVVIDVLPVTVLEGVA
jgi:Holliday junction resolvase RusA-like endonuclease